MDNKFGKCCKCPARMDSMRQFTEYRSSNAIVRETMEEYGFTNIHQYNEYMDKVAFNNARLNLSKQEENYTCKSDKNNSFYPDTLDYHARFDEQLKSVESDIVVPCDKHVLKNVLSTQPRANYTAKNINNDMPLFTMAKPFEYSI